MLKSGNQTDLAATDHLSIKRSLSFYMACTVAGSLIGLVGAVFQLLLQQAGQWRQFLVETADRYGIFGFLIPVIACSVCAYLARFLVTFSQRAAGSGIQYVEADYHHEVKPAHLRVLSIKFFGGLFALGGGLALGREGPTVQMGAVIGAAIARWLKMSQAELRDITTALAGAGLAVAFSAPLGGAMFVFEEVARNINPKLVLSTLISVGIGTAVSTSIIGSQPDFIVSAIEMPQLSEIIFFALFGIYLGFFGVLYNKTILHFLNWNKELQRFFRPTTIAAAVGALVGVVLWLSPDWVGGGEVLNQQLLRYERTIPALFAIGVLRWFLASLSYSTEAPGGLFSPLLLMGAILGCLFAWIGQRIGLSLDIVSFCLVGMSGFFAATVRAPITGVLLLLEMTTSYSLTVAMVVTAVTAVITATTMRDQPIYTALRIRLLLDRSR